MKAIMFIMMFMFNMINVKADDMCYETYTFKTESIISTFFKYVGWIVPVVLVILISIDLAKGMINHDVNEIDKSIGRSLKRLVIAILIFTVPNILMLVVDSTLGTKMFQDTDICISKELASGSIYAPIVPQIDPFGDDDDGDDEEPENPDDSISGDGCNSGTYSIGPGGSHYKKTITINCRTYKIYNQHSYGNTQFIKSGWTISRNGCSLCSLAIALSGYDPDIDPLDLSKYYRVRSISREAAAAYGYHFVSLSRNADAIREYLNQGIPVIFLEGNTPTKKYAGFRHFIVILGETNDGKLVLGNSSSSAEFGTFNEILKVYPNYGLWAIVKN